MDWLFDNFQILLVIGLALAAWLKNRGESAQEEEAEREAREEMVRQLREMEDRQVEKTGPPPPPVPQRWDTRPQVEPSPEASPPKPPPLKDIFREVMESLEPPLALPQAAPKRDAYDQDEMTPWKRFQHENTADTEIGHHDPLEGPMLRRQREMKDRLAEIKKQTAQYKGTVAGARETQRRVAHKGKAQEELVPLGSLRSTLQDKRQVKRAVVLREILGKPLALR